MKKSKYSIFKELFQKKIQCRTCGDYNSSDAKFCKQCTNILKTYNAFISYRRKPDAGLASLLVEKLNRLWEKDVFIDVDELQVGRFDEKLLKVIEETPSFILLLSPGCLDRCINKTDWLKQEIMHAIKTKRNIIPVTTDGFEFSKEAKWKQLPSAMRELESYQVVQYMDIYKEASINRIASFMNVNVKAFISKIPNMTARKSDNDDVQEAPKNNIANIIPKNTIISKSSNPMVQIGKISTQIINSQNQNKVNIGNVSVQPISKQNSKRKVSLGTITVKII